MKYFIICASILVISAANIAPDYLNNLSLCASFYNVNRTFDNIWEIFSEYQKTGRLWNVLKAGSCSEYDDCKGVGPVCAVCAVSSKNYYRTFENQCMLEAEQNVTGSVWKVVSEGVCLLNHLDDLITPSSDVIITPKTLYSDVSIGYKENSHLSPTHPSVSESSTSPASALRPPSFYNNYQDKVQSNYIPTSNPTHQETHYIEHNSLDQPALQSNLAASSQQSQPSYNTLDSAYKGQPAFSDSTSLNSVQQYSTFSNNYQQFSTSSTSSSTPAPNQYPPHPFSEYHQPKVSNYDAVLPKPTASQIYNALVPYFQQHRKNTATTELPIETSTQTYPNTKNVTSNYSSTAHHPVPMNSPSSSQNKTSDQKFQQFLPIENTLHSPVEKYSTFSNASSDTSLISTQLNSSTANKSISSISSYDNTAKLNYQQFLHTKSAPSMPSPVPSPMKYFAQPSQYSSNENEIYTQSSDPSQNSNNLLLPENVNKILPRPVYISTKTSPFTTEYQFHSTQFYQPTQPYKPALNSYTSTEQEEPDSNPNLPVSNITSKSPPRTTIDYSSQSSGSYQNLSYSNLSQTKDNEGRNYSNDINKSSGNLYQNSSVATTIESPPNYSQDFTSYTASNTSLNYSSNFNYSINSKNTTNSYEFDQNNTVGSQTDVIAPKNKLTSSNVSFSPQIPSPSSIPDESAANQKDITESQTINNGYGNYDNFNDLPPQREPTVSPVQPQYPAPYPAQYSVHPYLSHPGIANALGELLKQLQSIAAKNVSSTY